MARIDLVALQQRLAQQQPKPATPVPAEPPSWSTRPARISLAHHAGAESTPSRRFGCGTGGHAARDDDHARGPALESDERTCRGTGEGECAAGADRRTERRVGGGQRRGRRGRWRRNGSGRTG